MSADELRQAAQIERAEWGGQQNARNYPTSSAIHLALADWLDVAADALDEGFDDNWPILMAPVHLARIINGSVT